LIAARTTNGKEGHTVEALPIDRLIAILKKYNRVK